MTVIYSNYWFFKLIPRFQIRYEPLNLNRLQYLIDTERIDPTLPINMHTLSQSGAVGKIKHGVKLLGDVSWRPRIQ